MITIYEKVVSKHIIFKNWLQMSVYAYFIRIPSYAGFFAAHSARISLSWDDDEDKYISTLYVT